MKHIFVKFNERGGIDTARDAEYDGENHVIMMDHYDGPFEVPDDFGNNDELAYFRKKGARLVRDDDAFAKYQAERSGCLAEECRIKRNDLLAASDFSQAPDYPMTDENREQWRIYRQSLRDVTKQPGFPDVIQWPEAP